MCVFKPRIYEFYELTNLRVNRQLVNSSIRKIRKFVASKYAD